MATRTITTVAFENGVQVSTETEEVDVAVPQIISPRQMRLELLARGLLDGIPTLLASLPDGVREAAQIEWEYATEIRIDHPVLDQMANALNFTSNDLDEFFLSASER